MINENMKIEEAVKIKPDVVEILNANNIDFCCGGYKNLGQSIKEEGLDVDEFIDKLNAFKSEMQVSDWRLALKLNKRELIDYIVVNHHRTEEVLIEEVEKLLGKILSVHYENHGQELTKIYQLFLALKSDLMPHFAEEEKIIFPNALNTESIDWTKLRDDHEKAGDLLRELQKVTNDFTAPSDGCNTYRLAFKKLHELVDDIHLHIFLENSVLFEK